MSDIDLTVGMATHKDYPGTWATVQALRLYHREALARCEILVVDNAPHDEDGHGIDCKALLEWKGPEAARRYIPFNGVTGTSAPRDLIFRKAKGKAVLCVDSHVLIEPNGIQRLLDWYDDHPDTNDLHSGPMFYDDLNQDRPETHFADEWRAEMWGTWAHDERYKDRKPFEIGAMGLGLFSCRKAAWLGFPPGLKGFGGEEWCLHEQFRKAGRKCVCLPWLKWSHRFSSSKRMTYVAVKQDKVRNYIIWHDHLGLPLDRVRGHFVGDSGMPEVEFEKIVAEARAVKPMPKVVAVCATYSKVPSHQHLLEEAIESFLRQDYQNKEMIVLNDNPAQTLVCDAPGVKVVNLKERMGSVGEKLNFMIGMTDAELYCPWDDDDVSLPWRISQGVEKIGTADYWKPPQVWFMPKGTIPIGEHTVSYRHHASIIRKAAWERVGKYGHYASEFDADMDKKLDGLSIPAWPSGIPKKEWAYIYRWGMHPWHISGMADTEAFYKRVGELAYQPGTFVLKPRWLADYETMVKAADPAPDAKAYGLKLLEEARKSSQRARMNVQPNWCKHLGPPVMEDGRQKVKDCGG